MSDLFQRFAVLSPKKRALVARLLKQKTSKLNFFPLSSAQQRLWFLDRWEPQSHWYNIPMAVRLQGQLNIFALEESLNQILERHEILRTSFTTIEGQLMQVIAPVLFLSLPVIDLEALSAAQREMQTDLQIQHEADLAFDLQQGPLLRVTLLRLGEEEHVLLLTMHHIVSDGWSLGVLLREVSTLYACFSAGKPSALPSLPIQYADYALWQRQWLQGEEVQHHLSYWQAQLRGAPETLELPTDRPRPSILTLRGARHSFALPRALSEELRTLSQREGVTLFMTLLAAFAILLSRASHQDDLLVGTPIANRRQRETEALIGCFMNTLVLRCDLSGYPSFRAFLGRMREVCLGAYAHQDLPFEQVVEALHPLRDLSHTPLFQVMFALQNMPIEELDLPGLHLRPLAVKSTTAKFELTLTLNETEQGLLGVLEYNTDLFEGSTISRMISHYQTLLESIVAHPEQSITRLSLLRPAEREDLLTIWKSSSAPGQSLPQLFEEQVRQRPEAIALVCGEQHLSYQQLDRQANRLAHFLLQRGIEAEIRVGICLQRSLEMIIAVLAVLKAGGAYVPLDPLLPTERLAFQLTDAQVALLLTQPDLHAHLPACSLPIFDLDPTGQQFSQQPEETPAITGSPLALACILYTSGSTGQPKGVSILHQGIVRLVSAPNYVRLDHEQILLLLAPLSFDASIFEICGALLNGACLIIAPPQTPSLAELAALLDQRQISTLWLTAALFQQMVQAHPQVLSRVPQLLAGGEVLPLETVRHLLKEGSGQCLINGYGPTENTTFTCCFPMRSLEHLEGLTPAVASVPIGTPISGSSVYVLDTHLEPVPLGVVGELYTGGLGLARGYIHQPALTAERFVPDPFSQQPGARLYRSGDLVRLRSDGLLEFVGRGDQQVKLRGYRIELGEIETLLQTHPSVQQAVVELRERGAGDKHLLAYVIPSDASSFSWSALRAFLQQQLPEYMLPSGCLLLSAFPLTPTGKLDRRALPAPESSRQEAEEHAFAPRSPEEELLAGLWSQVLGVVSVSVHDNFFELGGHSLLATQVMARIRETWQVELPLRALFEAPTVAALAERIEMASQAEQGLQIPPLHPFSRTQELPLSFAQERLWFLNQLEPDSPLYNASFALSLQGELNSAALERSFQALVQRHEALRTTFGSIEGRPVQHVHPMLPVHLPIVELTTLPEPVRMAQVQRMIQQEALAPFDLALGPLLRAYLLRLGDREQVLLLNMHHIVSDGWSLGVLLREVSTLYACFSAGKPSALPSLPIQYADYVLWQRQWLQGEVIQRHLSYWQAQLAEAPEVLELPTDRARRAVQTFRGAHEAFQIAAPLSQALKALSLREGVTPFMTLLAAFAVLLSRVCGQKDLLVGTPIANRRQRETEALIGCFLNMLVLRCDLSGDPSFRAFLGRVREICLGAYAHQDLPFEQVVEALHPQRNLSHTPLFQVLFVLQNMPIENIVLPGLQLRSLAIEQTTAKFDLMLVLNETDQGLVATFEYNTDLFEAATIARMAGHYQTLLHAIVADPQQPLSRLPLLTQAEQHYLLVTCNATQTPYLREACLHHLFEAQVQRTPTAIALQAADQSLSYLDLNIRANQLAHHLQRLGVGPETRVGLCLMPSSLLLIALLAILKAGAAFVPLDPSTPALRLAFILQDAQIALLLTQAGLCPQAAAEPAPQSGTRRLDLDTCWETIQQEPEEPPQSQALPEQLAYLIYTSGSTGRPKGVMIGHRGLVNYLHWCLQTYAVAQGQGALVHTSISFDLTLTALLAPLLAGQRVILPASSPQAQTLLSALDEGPDLSFLKLTPTHLDLLSHLLPSHRVQRASRTLIVGGEALSGEHLAFWRKAAPNSRIFNEYGPTETVVGCCVYEVPEEQPLTGRVPIGRPIANTQIYLLDPDLNPVPQGSVGEMYIGGEGLARGYWRQPDLTAERFVPDLFSSQPGQRLYRTGDLARCLPSGDLDYLGRSDEQIKLHGYRIEPAEIVAGLREHPDVEAATLLLREESPSDKRLVAYVVARAGQKLALDEVRVFLKERLPTAMLPSVLIQLPALPLTPHGKIDRLALPVSGNADSHALPQPEGQSPDLAVAFVAPRTPAEEVLAGIWSTVLKLERVGIHDNFFTLGGDSILSIQTIAHARRAGLHFTPKQAFQFQTIAELAAAADTLPVLKAEQGLVRGLVPLTPIQHWFFEQQFPDPQHWNQSMLLEVPYNLQADLFEKSMKHLLLHHDALRLRFRRQAMGWEQSHASFNNAFSFMQVDISVLHEAVQTQITAAIAAETQAHLNLSEGPLLRCVLFTRRQPQPGLLLLVVHHLMIDGVSWRIVLEDLQTMYQQRSRGEVIHLPTKTTSFQQWARRLMEYARSASVHQEQTYWLAESRTRIQPLPRDYPEGANTEASACTIATRLTVEETQVLLQEIPKTYRTQINDVLLTALGQTLRKWTGMDTHLVDVEGHGREDIMDGVDVSRTVGWFTILAPLLLNLEGFSDPVEALKAIKEQVHDMPNRGIGYGILRYLSANKEISMRLQALPQAEICFNYLGQFDYVIEGSSLFLRTLGGGGMAHSPRGHRSYLIEITGIITGGQLHLEWRYSENLYLRSTIEDLAQSCIEALRSLIVHCQSSQAQSYTPSDFPEAFLSQTELDALIAELDEAGENL